MPSDVLGATFAEVRMTPDEITSEVLEMREKLFVASAMCAAIAEIALKAPRPLADELETLARTARAAIDESLTIVGDVLAFESASFVAA
jgi:hypothetical protein